MRRRKLLSTIALTGLTGCTSSVGEPEGSMSGKEFGFGSPGFDRIEWINLDVLRIYFEPDHGMDGFGIKHSFDEEDDLDNNLLLCEAPRFEGPVDYPIIDEISSSSVKYPNRTFDLIGYDGQFSECGQQFQLNFVEEVLGTVSFTIPASIAPRPNFKDLDTFTRETLAVDE